MRRKFKVLKMIFVLECMKIIFPSERVTLDVKTKFYTKLDVTVNCVTLDVKV